jgi:hypothetical protein
MGRILRLAGLLSAGLLAACVSSQTVTPQQVSSVKTGQTTYDQVVSGFGLPDYEVNLSGGSKILLYHRGEFERSATQVIPYVNLFESNYDQTPYDFFIVGRDGVVQSYSIPHFAQMAGVQPPTE